MAASLKDYYSAGDALHALARQVPYQGIDILIGDSDTDESPHAVAERNQRREAIGRRYLLGHTPLIQTASLRGPFGRKSGWVTPWGRFKVCLEEQNISIGTRNPTENILTKETVDAESGAIGKEGFAGDSVEEGLVDEHIDDDTGHYDADNEDDAFEEVDDEGSYLLPRVGHLDESGAKLNYLSYGERQSRDSSDNVSNTSEKDFHAIMERSAGEDSGEIRTGFLQSNGKRKADTGWPEGLYVRKRTRNELQEKFPSTNICRAIRESNKRLQIESTSKISDVETSGGRENSEVLPLPTTNKPALQIEATCQASNFPAVCEANDEASREHIEQGTRFFMIQNRKSVTAHYEDLTNNNLARHDIKGLLQGSKCQSVFTQPLRMQQEEIALYSPLTPDIGIIGTLSCAPPVSDQGVNNISLQSWDQVTDNNVNGLSAIPIAITDDHMVSPHSNDNVDCHDLPYPASQGSFHYKKQNRKSRGRGLSLSPQKGEEEVILAGENKSVLESDARTLQPTDHFPHHSSNPVYSDNARGLEMRKGSPIRSRQGERRQHQTTSPVSNADASSALGVVSSPDPLSEDLNFKDTHRLQTTPDMDQGWEQKLVKQFQDDVVTPHCQHIVVAQAYPASYQDVSRTQQSALPAAPQVSTSGASGSHMKISAGSPVSMRGQLSDFNAKKSVLLAKARGADVNALVQGSKLNRTSSSQPESPKMGNTSTHLPNNLQQVDVMATSPIRLRDYTEPLLPPDSHRRVGSSSESIPTYAGAEVLEEPARSMQSPWTAISVESRQPDLSLDKGPNGSAHSVTKRHLGGVFINQPDSVALSTKAGDESEIDSTSRGEGDSFNPSHSPTKHATQSPFELGQRFPSTQTLVDAATANPWNSAFKKPKIRKWEKRVSFGSLPLKEFGDATSNSSAKPMERMGSPPLPEGTLRLTQLDDPFHHRLKATRYLEVTEESLTKFMNTPWDEIPTIKPCTKPPPSSPTVAAMAEAFIAADQQNLNKKLGIKERSTSERLASARTKAAEGLKTPTEWAALEHSGLRDCSPPDASFSIAPNGTVTAVSIGNPGYDAEDNLHAVIEDMGNFLQGWDLESELKKAKVQKPEKRDDTRVPRKREYLSGISNR